MTWISGLRGAAARLRDRDGVYGLDDLTILLGSEERLQLDAAGNIARVTLGDDVSLDMIDLLVSFRSTDMQSISDIVGQQLSELGEIEGSFRLSGSDNLFAIKEATLSTNSADGLHVVAAGRIGSVNLAADEPFKEIDFTGAAPAPDSSPFERILDVDLPQLGPVHLSARAIEKNSVIDIQEIDLRVGAVENATLSARGEILNIQLTASRELLRLVSGFRPFSRTR